ncbi:3'(2'),5'-bisphosphate nucleotidase CysQ [Campylobacter fetus]|uniref:3'(2'),5'-bisphosphate nucleotidase CysQ family protein n=1 Tax=Campylobacter fetus TaxID=196 RepID=UPI00081874E0|nr:3'(2'),5'-bisphosphate nucleotidase CysQ [Campylobacter fetus]OCR87601.1 3'-5'-bisphosphate nucleotidase [Campylobacter fetus subsp. testudinum]OCR91871.1 3'-5'-bisphosphate nucleotidase [Campylobacter fetus subsp. testudinum]OCR97515.1 3'-5'-bisphosphate nucleotidase [Campylobacter fetus subsp. testudinum]OCS03002.1 3'-5'-bisphosphate nucleotidase [Campylobacter fetus subsp. testudinum]
MQELLNLSLKAAKAAGKAILRHYDNYDVTIKNDNSPLTSADLASNEAIFKELESSGIPICSEEKILDYKKRDGNSKFWLIDPLDGTKEFIAKNGEFCVCIALIDCARPILSVIYAPTSDEMFYSMGGSKVYKNGEILNSSYSEQNYIISGNFSHSKSVDIIANHFRLGILRYGSALKFCRLSEGKADVYARFCGSSIWDIAAGEFLLKESGGIVVSLQDEKELRYDKEDLRNDYFLALSKKEIPNLKNYLEFISLNLKSL